MTFERQTASATFQSTPRAIGISYDISVVAPCYNEEKNVPVLIERLQHVFEKKKLLGEIVLVDDASKDGTRASIRTLQGRWPNIKFVAHDKNQGIAQSWKDGVAGATGKYVCLMDSDLQNLPEDVWRLYREITFTNTDVVSGWRSHVEPRKDLSYIASKGLSGLLNALFDMNLRDNKSGFLITRKETLKHILAYRFSYHHPQTFIGVSAHTKGYTIHQIETLFDKRRAGASYLAGSRFFREAWYTLLDCAKGFIEFRFLRGRERSLRHFLNEHPARAHPEEPLPFGRRVRFLVYQWTFPLHHWLITRQSLKHYADMKESQWLSPEDIRTYQEERLRRLINHAYHHVHFYRDMFDERGLKPDDIRTLDDLQRLPIIDKKVVRENLFLGLLAEPHDKRELQKGTTSGSTGEPFYTFLEKRQIEMRFAATLRSVEWTGYRFGDRVLRLWHKYLALNWKQIVREILDAKLMRRGFIPAYEMDEEGLEKFMRAIDEARPVFIDGYAESFNFIAKYLKRRGWHGHKPKGIMTSAQMLPDESRRIIEEAFGCKVYDKYGAREFGGGLAYDCEAGDGHHVVAECGIIEILKDGRPARPGEVGEVVITELNNYAAPLIRYRIGDLAVQMDPNALCKCGRGLPRIGRIEGRIQAMMIGTANRFVPGSFFARLFADQEHIVKQFQVTQEKPGAITLNIVKGPLFDEAALAPVLAEIRKHLGDDVEVSLSYVDAVKLGRTGKRQHSLSKVEVGEILDTIAQT